MKQRGERERAPKVATAERQRLFSMRRRIGVGVAAASMAITSFLSPAPVGLQEPHSTTVAATAEVASSPKALAAETLPSDEHVRQQHRSWLSQIALAQTVETSPEIKSNPATSLLMQIDRAIAGNEQAYNSVLTNARTTLVEAYFKTGNVTEVTSQFDENGALIQYNQPMRSVYENALALRPNRLEELKEVTRLESLNGHRIEDYAARGLLKDHNFVIFSLVPDNVPEEALGKHGDGYFTDTLTYVAQVTSSDGKSVHTESAFIGGISEDVTPEQRQAKRHDITAVNAVRAHFGLPPIASTKEGLERGMLIPKQLMPGGVIDLVQLGDQALGPDFFFGQKQTPEDYALFKKKCQQREANLNAVAEKIVADLCQARQAGNIMTRMDAIIQMYETVKKHAVNHAIDNTAIDASVLGKEAELEVKEARQRYQAGDRQGGDAARSRAQRTAEIAACGGGSTARSKTASLLPNGHTVSEKLRQLGKTITTNCPYCGTNGTEATVYKDEDGGAIQCNTCDTVKDFCEEKPNFKSKNKVNELRKLKKLPPI